MKGKTNPLLLMLRKKKHKNISCRHIESFELNYKLLMCLKNLIQI